MGHEVARKPQMCGLCGTRPAKFFYRGRLQSDPKGGHDLCTRCHRAGVRQAIERQRHEPTRHHG